MIKNLLMILAVSVLLFSCNNETKKDVTESNVDAVQLTVDELLTNIDTLVEKNVEVTGLVSHICLHGGKKLKLIAENSENEIHFNAGGEISEFEKSLEGSTVKISGIVKELRIDNKYLDKMVSEEQESTESEEHKNKEADSSKEEEEHIQEGDNDHHSKEMDQINKLREEIKNSEKGYLSEYSVLCSSYKLVESVDKKEKTESK
ncbi:MAG: hypothetical protein PF487_00925 [Bacteroidales bacterium]|jgi:hypothetical protein|nr:hypothetical protein [Bacteroidales bacterium]